MAFLSLLQCILLASFAAILSAHRSEILDKNNMPLGNDSADESEPTDAGNSYEPPREARA